MSTCQHENFIAKVDVHRLEDSKSEDGLRCMVDLHVECENCHAPLRFACPLGINLAHGATMSLDGTEARLTASIGIPRSLGGPTGFGVREMQ